MPNWYQKEKEQPLDTSRYVGTMMANIEIPAQIDKEQEVVTAKHVLDSFLPESTDASARTAIESTVNIQVIGVEQRG